MKILIIDNNIDPPFWGSKDICKAAASTSPGATLYVRRGPQEDLPNSPLKYDRIILSGSKTSALENSAWINRLLNFLENSITHRVPILGICFGHQILARLYSKNTSCVGKAKTPEFGWTPIELIAESKLLAGLPNRFFSFSAHFEEVTKLPSGLRTLARSEYCAIQAFEDPSRPVFGIQFHPEKEPQEANFILRERKKTGIPKKLFLDQKKKSLYNPRVSETLFANFLKD
ncbi:MAG: type 1 glutamine amidotransferase [Bdellovibrio sp.]|nr:type 1 glutamine amidotransferase [Bdellovibrio sp.]